MASGNSVVDLYEAAKRQPSSKSRQQPPGKLVRAQPKSAEDLVNILTDPEQFPSPVRPVGSGSSVTRCGQTASGTIVDMTRLDRVLAIKGDKVLVQAGVRLRDLAEHLAADNLELVGGCQDPNRTVGGVISSASLGARMPDDGAQMASTVCHITLINGEGRRVEVSQKLPDLLALMRMSYGLLGIIYAVTLRIRPIQPYSISNTKVDFPEFVQLIPNLMEAQAAVRASFFPFRNRVHVELRYPNDGDRKAKMLPWKLRDWATHSALPRMVRSVNRAVPVKALRGPLIDTVTAATHALNGFAEAGSNAAEQTGRFRALTLDEEMASCVWFFPVDQFVKFVPVYVKFCQAKHEETGYRCDLPADVWRVNQDASALLSPSRTGPCFAINLRSTSQAGWDDYLIEFSELASAFQGIPQFNLTRGFKPSYASKVFGEPLQQFINMRARLDAKGRFLNQYFAEHLR